MNPVNARTPAIAAASLALVGATLWPVRVFVRGAGAMQARPPPAEPAGLAAGRWATAALSGGMRALAADGLWLKAYAAWSARDCQRTEALLHWVTAVDERPLYFWVNGARVIACDVAEWRLSAMDAGRAPAEVRRRVVEEQAGAALKYLNAALNCHPECAAIWIEMANIHLYRRGDLVRAAECYRRAAESPGAPFYAARIHAELLRRVGRDQEAYVWLCRVHRTLPGEDEAAMSGLVLQRIRNLEGKLRVPEKERYAPPDRPAAAAGAAAG